MKNNGLVVRARPGEPITLGRKGENFARQIIFDLKQWEEIYGPGVAQVIVQRTGETTPYPVPLTLDGSHVIWTVTDADTAIHGMSGKAELRYYVGETLAKSETWRTIVLDSLGEPSEEPPEPQKSWVDQVLDAANRTEAAATHTPYPNTETGTWWVWNIETGEYEDSGASFNSAFTAEIKDGVLVVS